MSLQNQFSQILKYLNDLPGNPNVFFEAHYWGRFRLLTNDSEVFPDPQGFIPLAQIQSPPFDTWLMIDTERELIVLRESDAHQPKVIAHSLDAFWGNITTLKEQLKQNTGSYSFDQRKSLEQLLPAGDFINTTIDDPEFFEELEGYYELLHILAELSNGDLLFSKISGTEKGLQKTLSLQRENHQWQLQVNGVLFDQGFIQGINGILSDLGIKDYTLATSVNADLRMVVMKLGTENFVLLNRMGLLV